MQGFFLPRKIPNLVRHLATKLQQTNCSVHKEFNTPQAILQTTKAYIIMDS